MGAEYRSWTVTIEPGSSPGDWQVDELTMPARVVRAWSVRVPPGPSGLVGFAFASAGVRVLPWNAGEWFILDGQDVTFPVTRQIDSGAWQVWTYNLGVFTHRLHFRAELDIPQLVGRGDGALLPVVLSG